MTTPSPPLDDQTIDVLLLEDSTLEAELTIARLASAFPRAVVTHVDNGPAFESAVRGQRFDVILSDMQLPRYSGVDAVAFVKRLGIDTPFVLVSGAIPEEDVADLLRGGATDFVSKNRLQRLDMAVSCALREARARAALAHERERLTGLESQNAELTAEIAERLRALSDSEQRLKLATEAGAVGVWELDLASGTLMTSRLCRENFGRDPSLPFPYDELRAAVHPDDKDRMVAAVMHSVETGADYEIEYRAVQPGGRIAWVQISARVQRNAKGESTRMVGTSRDVTGLHEAAQRSQLLLDLDRDAFGALDDPIEIAGRVTQALGQLFEVSRVGYGTVDKTREAITIEREWNAPTGRPLSGTMQFRDYGAFVEDLKHGQSVFIDDTRLDPRTVDSADALEAIGVASLVNVPVHASEDLVALLYLNHGRARHWSLEERGFIREVGARLGQAVERRRAAQRLRALAESLEIQVQERSTQLLSTEAALRQSQKMEAVGQLTGGLAHDFNNLLAAISGSLEVLQRKRPDPASAEFERMLQIGRSATKKAAALTHRLLAFSRQQALEPKRLNVNRLVRGIEDLVRRTIGTDIALEVAVAADLWTVEVDPSQLENSLLNLCINARDAMPQGGRVVIETANRWIDDRTARGENVEPGPYVLMSVSDTGTGMPAQILARAFDPFFTTKPAGLGTGLGLSMVYGFAKQSHGYARIQSEVGRGTTVSVYLPRLDGDEQAQEADAASGASAQADAGQTIVVVDDEDEVRELVAATLRDAGYRVHEASDGLQATDLLQAVKRIDLLVTDIGLPGGMNGRQVADAARVARPDLPVLFITGFAESALSNHGQLGTGIHVLAKPFELSELASRAKSAIAEALVGHQRPDATPRYRG